MPETWVVNASPIISLAKVGQLKLLESLARELILPEAVAGEVLAGPPDDPARVAIAAGWGRRQSPATLPDPVVEWGLGQGETSVLALALERSATAVLDDAAARAAARAIGVPLIGTLGVLLRARLRGLLPTMAPVIAALRAAGLRLDDKVVRAVLERAGET